MRKPILAGLVVAVVLVMSASVAWATGLTTFGFVGNDGSIIACIHNPDGNIRLIDPTSAKKELRSCKTDETQLTLNQKGQKGDTGATGQAGPQGPPGSSPGPGNVTVDCAAGQRVQDALDANANATSLDINIVGTCTESVNVTRDNISLHAASTGSGLIAASSGQPVISVEGRHVQIDGLTIVGGSGLWVQGGWVQAQGVNISGGSDAVTANDGGNASVFDSTLAGTNSVVSAGQGGSVQLGNVTVQGSSGGFAINASTGGTVSVGQSTISGGRDGVIANPGGSAQIFNTTIEDSTENGLFAFGGDIVASGGSITGVSGPGVSAYAGGYVDLHSGVRVAHDGIGVANFGGRILLQDGVVIESNGRDGLMVSNSSSVSVEGPVTIRNNNGNGVHIQDNSVASFGSGDEISGNGGLGIFCDASPAHPLIVGPPAPAGVSSNCNHG
jgi:hypothetical protein